MRRMRREYRSRPKSIDSKRKRPSGLRNFKIQAKFKPKRSGNLKWRSTAIQMAAQIRYLRASSEHVATAGLEIELPTFDLPGEVD